MSQNQETPDTGRASSYYGAAFVPEPAESDPREQLEVYWRRKWALIVVALTIFAAGVVYTATRRPVYETNTELLVNTDAAGALGSSSSGGSGASSALSQMLTGLAALSQTHKLEAQVAILNSPDTLDKAIAMMTPAEMIRGFGVRRLPADWAYVVSADDKSDVITLTLRAYDRNIAAKMANTIAEAYRENDRETSTQSTHQAQEYVKDALKGSLADLQHATRDLATFKKRAEVLDVKTQESEAAGELVKIQNLLDTAGADVSAEQGRLAVLRAAESKLAPELQMERTITGNPDFQLVQSHLEDLRNKLTDQGQEFQPDAPEIKTLQTQITAEEERLRQVTKQIVASVRKVRNPLLDGLLTQIGEATANEAIANVKRNYYTNLIAAKRQADKVLPDKEREFTEIDQRVQAYFQITEMLAIKNYALQIDEKSAVAYAQVIKRARPPGVPAYPEKVKNYLTFIFLGIMFGIGCVLLLERLDTRIHDPGMVDRITGLTTLTAVPETKRSAGLGEGQVLIGAVDNPHAFLEAFRLLRNNIAFSAPDRQLRILSVTSASKGEGKSTVSVNLAIAMGMDGKRVLLIDGDLRRPTLHTYLGLRRDVGFTNVVKGTATMDEVVFKTEFENVYCLTAGPLPPNPTEFLNSSSARRMIEEASANYDIVIIDSPPCTGLSDVQVVSTVVDGIIVVVALESTQKQYLAATIRLLQQAGAPVIGTVLNRLNYRRNVYGYYGYYGYYSYYYYNYYGQDDEEATPGKGRRRKTKS